MFKPDQFTSMKHNPFACKPGERIWHRYPDLKQQVALCQVPNITNGEGINVLQPEEDDLDMLVKYVILMVERHGNPLANVKDFEYRSKLVCDLIGLKRSANGVWYFIEADHYWFRDVMFEYFRLLNDDEYQLWFSMKTSFSNNMKLLRESFGPSTDEKYFLSLQKIKASSPDDLRKIKEVEMRLFNDERTREIVTKEAIATDRDAEKRALEEFWHGT